MSEVKQIRAFDPQAHAAAMRAAGFWVDNNFDSYFGRALRATPEKPALVAWRADREAPRRFTYRELGDCVSRCAGSLRALGVQRGDVVAVQLPNWWEFAVLTLACCRLGAVVNPLMPIFRERELQYMLEFAGAKVLVVPKLFRGFDHEAMAGSLRAGLKALKQVIVVDGLNENGFEQALLSSGQRVEYGEPEGLRPDELAVLMYTSGTTGSPKGVMHTSNTLVACTSSLSHRFGLDGSDVLHVCSPMGHMTGFAAGFLLSIRLGATAVLQDIWEARQGASIMAKEGATYTAGATPFLADMCEAVAAGSPRPARLKSFLCGGAPIPPALIERAARELDLSVCSLWGMTEALSATLTEPDRAADKSASTDGRALDGVQVRVSGEDGQERPRNQIGRLLVRGAQMFVGYFKRPDIPTFDTDGWFDTGDLAYMDDEGYIRISGRTKDVLIRGGENVPVVEIEALLHSHPAVHSAAIVGYPDARLGERACAFLVLRPGASLDLRGVQDWMAEHKVAKQYWPERIKLVADLPRTPTGKIQKFVLRDIAATATPAPSPEAR